MTCSSRSAGVPNGDGVSWFREYLQEVRDRIKRVDDELRDLARRVVELERKVWLIVLLAGGAWALVTIVGREIVAQWFDPGRATSEQRRLDREHAKRWREHIEREWRNEPGYKR